MSLQDVTNENLYTAVLLAWVNPVVGPDVEVVRSRENAPKGKTVPYVAVDLTHFDQVGWDERDAPDGTTGDVVVRGMRETTLSVDVFGTGGLDLCRAIRNAIGTVAVQAALHALGVAFGPWSGILNLTQRYELQWKERGMFTVVLRYRSETLDAAVGLVTSVPSLSVVPHPPADTSRAESVTVGP